jgi:flagellar biosynthesis/type III secretory pathway chaperone
MNGLEPALTDHFRDLRERLTAMRGLLEREAEQLKQRDADGLAESSRDKALLSTQIARLTESQDALLAARQLMPGRKGMDALLASLPAQSPETGVLRASWREIQSIGKDCQRLNECNGAYIGLLSRHVERSLDLLHGRDTQEFVYGPDGGSRRPKAMRSLVAV